MADKLDQFLQPGERVRYREPEPQSSWSTWFTALAHGIAVGAVSGATSITKGGFTTFLSLLLIMLAGRVAFSPRLAGTVEAAVTDRRVLRVKGEGAAFEFTEVMADEVEVIEVLGAAVRLTRRDGKVVVLEQLAGAPALGLALARAAGRPAPWVPGPKERLAEEIAVLAGLIAGALAYSLALVAQLGEASETVPWMEHIGAVLFALAVSPLGWLLGTLAGLALLTPHFSHAGMRAWMRQSALFAPKPQPGARTGRFTRFCLQFVGNFYGPSVRPDQEETGRGS